MSALDRTALDLINVVRVVAVLVLFAALVVLADRVVDARLRRHIDRSLAEPGSNVRVVPRGDV